ncbi:MAG: alpha/beta fold hydrolase [Anaerolineae bacterium]|nr:alpha/beta fold hydrolase [Anaerolineae bacterium]
MEMPQDRTIQVGSINVRYWEAGSRGSPVVLIHGISEYVETWLPSFAALAARHHVYAMDLLGHGRTDKPLDVSYQIADLAQFVHNVMLALQVERAHVVGHSLGGAIATRLALLYPEAVDKLVLVSSAGLGKEAALVLRLCSVPLLGEVLTRPDPAGSLKGFKSTVFDPTIITAEWGELGYRMASLPGAQKAFLRTLRANGNPFGQSASMVGPNMRGLAAIKNPVLVVWGREDPVVPVAHAEVAAKGLADVRVHIFDQCGHNPMLEHTEAFNSLLLDFLGE